MCSRPRANLRSAVSELGLAINLIKIEANKFRRSGGLVGRDTLYLSGWSPVNVSRFIYLGLLISCKCSASIL